MTDDNKIPVQFHGLNALSTRQGWRNLADTKRGDTPSQQQTGSPETVHLSAGTHTLRLRPGNDRSHVAGIVITDDPTWWPVTGTRRGARE